MKYVIQCIVLILFSLGIKAQDTLKKFYPDRLKDGVPGNNIYIFCKGTTSKSALVGQKFNYSDTNITHLGIGYFEGTKAAIFNVSDKRAKSALTIDSIPSFVAPADVYYFSIWKCAVSDVELIKLKSILKLFQERNIFFDWAFDLDNGNDVLYCSEFCAMILNNLKFKNYFYKPHTIALNNSMYESILERELFTFYPVDFFQQSHHFTKVFESRLPD